MLAHVTINFDYQFGRKIIKDTNERHAIDLPSPFTYKQAKEAAGSQTGEDTKKD